MHARTCTRCFQINGLDGKGVMQVLLELPLLPVLWAQAVMATLLSVEFQGPAMTAANRCDALLSACTCRISTSASASAPVIDQPCLHVRGSVAAGGLPRWRCPRIALISRCVYTGELVTRPTSRSARMSLRCTPTIITCPSAAFDTPKVVDGFVWTITQACISFVSTCDQTKPWFMHGHPGTVCVA